MQARSVPGLAVDYMLLLTKSVSSRAKADILVTLANMAQVDPDLQQFIEVEQQKAKFQTIVHDLTDQCWEKCVDKLGSKLDSRTSDCLSNCVERFIDSSTFIISNIQKKLQ